MNRVTEIFGFHRHQESRKVESPEELQARLKKRVLTFASQPYQKPKKDGVFRHGTPDFGFDVLQDEDIVRVKIHAKITKKDWYWWLIASGKGESLKLHRIYYHAFSPYLGKADLVASPEVIISQIPYNKIKEGFDPAELFKLIPNQVSVRTTEVKAIEVMTSGLAQTSTVTKVVHQPLLKKAPAFNS